LCEARRGDFPAPRNVGCPLFPPLFPPVHGAIDELGYHALEPGHYVTDLHATVLHLLGLDPRHLEVPGRKRLEIDFGRPIREVLA
jgi:hypothetical protein